MKILQNHTQLRKALSEISSSKTIGFVPTMGALHRGHQRLIRESVKQNSITIVSIFVNPLQFSPQEDLDAYPRSISKDCEVCSKLGADIVFTPEAQRFLKSKSLIRRRAGNLSKHMCGPNRPSHFDGVVTIVAFLFSLINPSKAYFGLKDFQQFRIIQEMTKRIFKGKISIVGVPTVRSASGLALSSRNEYLTTVQKKIAPNLYKELKKCMTLILAKHSISAAMRKASQALKASSFQIEYLEVLEAKSLQPITRQRPGDGFLVAAAVRLGKTRLIDNVLSPEAMRLVLSG